MVRLQSVSEIQDNQKFAELLNEWNVENSTTFKFPDISYPNRKEIFRILFKKIQDCHKNLPDSEFESLCLLCLGSIRILCREKLALDESFSDEKDIWLLFDLAGLRQQNAKYSPDIRFEAMKCLCNAIYNCPAVQGVSKNKDVLNYLISYFKSDTLNSSSCQLALLHAKILFLVTGFNSSMRIVAFEADAIIIILKFIEPLIGREADVDASASISIIELLKALFNIASSVQQTPEIAESTFNPLADSLRHLLLIRSEKIHEIHFQVAALITLLPLSSCSRLTLENDGTENFEAVKALVDHLDYILTDKPDTEHLVPLLVALTNISRANRSIRRYIRSQVLPPLHESDVRRLPQEGTTLRNRICRLLTSSRLDLKERSADFLFVLCKENVNRFIKYTGFGNAAGLLANRGLLGRTVGQQSKKNGQDYSSDSEQSVSDTEDYKNVRDEVNPVTGRVDPEQTKNPFEGMTEEQKEYEAMQLVNAIDRLQRQGIIQPVQLAGPDSLTGNSRQQPVEHVLQLREEYLKSRDLDNNENDKGDS